MLQISKEDFLVIFEGFEVVCSEYSGAKEVQEKYYPVLEKYQQIYDTLRKGE